MDSIKKASGFLGLMFVAFSAQAFDKIELGCFDRLFNNITGGKATTTSLRKEVKRVVSKKTLDKFYDGLEEIFGELQARDKITPGMANVTSTDYLPKFTWKNAETGRVQSAKVRVRKYLEKPKGAGNMKAQEGGWPANLVKLEFKVDHPTQEGVVLKHSIVMEEADAQRLLSNKASFERNKAEAATRTKALKDPGAGVPGNPQLIDEMIEGLGQMHNELGTSPEKPLKPILQIRYDRSSYQVELVDAAKTEPNNKVQVQFTFDRDIDYRHPETGKKLGKYDSDQRVVEIKIPLEYADMSGPFWETSEEAAGLKKIMAKLDDKQSPEFAPDSGKFGASKKLISEKMRKKVIKENQPRIEGAD